MAGEQEVDERAIAAARSRVGAGAQATLDPSAASHSGPVHCSAHHSRCAKAPGSRSRSSTPRPSRPVCGRSRLVRSRTSRAAVYGSTSWNGRGSRRSLTCWPPRRYRLHAVPGVGPQTVYQVVGPPAWRGAGAPRHPLPFRPGPTRPRSDPAARHPGRAPRRGRRPSDPARAAAGLPAPDRATGREAERTGSRFEMFFTGRAKKDPALNALGQLGATHRRAGGTGAGAGPGQRRRSSRARTRPRPVAGLPDDAASVNAAALHRRHRRQRHDEAEAARGFVPEELRQQVTAEPLDTTLLTASLRGYQEFGAQFALRAAAHDPRRRDGPREDGRGAGGDGAPRRDRGQRTFLVVCPASVLVNWQHEIAKHTQLTASEMHGARPRATARASGSATAASPSPPSTRCRLPHGAGGARRRSARGRRGALREEPGRGAVAGRRRPCAGARRVLFLTGTPMENRVEEFRSSSATCSRDVAARSSSIDGLAGARGSAVRSRPCTCGATSRTCCTSCPSGSRWTTGCRSSPTDETRTRRPSPPATSCRCAGPRSRGTPERSAKLDRLVELLDEAARRRLEGGGVHVLPRRRRSRRAARSGRSRCSGRSPARCRRPTGSASSTSSPPSAGPAVLVARSRPAGSGSTSRPRRWWCCASRSGSRRTEEQAIARATAWARSGGCTCTGCSPRTAVDEQMREISRPSPSCSTSTRGESDVKDGDRRAVDAELHRPPSWTTSACRWRGASCWPRSTGWVSSDDLDRDGVRRATRPTRSSAVRASATAACRRARTVDPIRRENPGSRHRLPEHGVQVLPTDVARGLSHHVGELGRRRLVERSRSQLTSHDLWLVG